VTPFKGIKIVRKGSAKKILKKQEDVIRVESGRVVGSCGAPCFFKDKVVAFHAESNNDYGSSGSQCVL
jgi:hypothetical protein